MSDKETSPTKEPPRADRRASRRSLIAVPMLARWRDDREHEVKINSRDIGDGGIFFHANSNIGIGTGVEVTFTLPSDPGASGNRRLRVQGTVIRAEREAEHTGYGLRVTSSEILEMEDTVAQARQAVRRYAAKDSYPSSPSRVRKDRLLFLACGLVLLAILAGLAMSITRHAGDPVNAAAALRGIVAGVRSSMGSASPRDAVQSRGEPKQRALQTVGLMDLVEKKAPPGAAKHEAAERNPDAPAAQVQSLEVESTPQPRPIPFNDHNIQTLDFQKGKPVSPLGYIGDLPHPQAKPAEPVPTGSLASTPAKTETASARPHSTAVVLRATVGRDGSVEDVQQASGSVDLAPAAMAAIRHWKFQPDPGGAVRRQIYVTVNFTISTE